jgi:hypothetical protein
MKKDWIKENKSFDGKSMKQRRESFEEAQERKMWKAYKKRVRDEKDSIYNWSKSDTEKYRKEENRYAKKKHRKKNKKLWKNIISLNSYNWRSDIYLSYIIQKRKERYEEDEILFNNYGYYYLKKDVEPIFRRLNMQCYSEP